MRVNKVLIRVICLCLLILCISSLPALAQEPAADTETIPPIVVEPSGRLDLTLPQLGYSATQLNSENFEGVLRIDLPGNFQITPTENYFNLVTSHVQESLDQTASLQVSVNERPLAAVILTSQNTVSNTTRVDLPVGLLKNGRNLISLGLATGSSCENPINPMNVLIEETSTLSFGYQQNPYPTDLARYPFPFSERSLLKIPTILVLPDQPTSADLSAAATIAAGLGQMSGGEIELAAVPAGDLSQDQRSNNHLIVVGRPDDNSVLRELSLPLAVDSSTLKAGQGILQEIVSPWNQFRLILVASGLDDEGVSKASQTLNRQAHFLGMQGPAAIVLDLLPPSKTDDDHTTSMTLASLGYGDEVGYGATPKNYSFDFILPPGWRLEDPPYFVLKFAHAEILDPYQSMVDVKLNNLPIGSVLLDESNTSAGELTMTLPARQLRTGRNRLQVAVRMSLPNGDLCRDANDQRAWTVLSSESEIFLPYSAIDLPPNLELFPYPFSQLAGFNQTLIVLPDQPDSAFYNDVIRLAIQLGTPSLLNFIEPRIAYASEVDDRLRQNYHLILLGRPSENSLLREINASLPQPFEADSDTPKPLAVDNVAFQPDPNRDAGLLQVIPSPWNESNILLTVTGTSEAGLGLALEKLLEPNNNLKGNLAVVEPALDPLAADPNQGKSFSTDTRPPAPADEESSLNNIVPGSQPAQLADRWWK